MKKPSLIDRLTGIVGSDQEYDDYFEDEAPVHSFDEQPIPAMHAEQPLRPQVSAQRAPQPQPFHESSPHSWQELETENEGELAVDVYQTPDAIVVKALVAGVLPNNIDISVSRDMLTISGTREDEREVEDDGYFQRELYWGSFSRTILLPEEVDVDMADASERHGILIIRLPKINKARQAKLKVRSK
ncbi:MAG TPA: Hsp20/alpha crystallin family protein [Candidatus Paceibacterota bacterium]|nr:Hsp20/alpha crystallin family protein [Candidatus Paceibacterota bacterium]